MGLDADQAELVDPKRQALNGMEISYVMSHLVSGELINDPVNVRQLASLINFIAHFQPSCVALLTAPVPSLAVIIIFQ